MNPARLMNVAKQKTDRDHGTTLLLLSQGNGPLISWSAEAPRDVAFIPLK